VLDIYLVYARDTRYLMRYEGLSNLDADDDTSQLVRIDYSYRFLNDGEAEILSQQSP